MSNRTIAGLLIGAGIAFAQIGVIGTTALVASATTASSNPIPGVDVIVRKHPGGGKLVVHTDAKGNLSLGELAPGEYTVEIARTELDKTAGASGNGAPRYANIEVNYLLQRMEGIAQSGGDNARRRDVVIRLLRGEHGELSGTFVVPAAGDAKHQHGSTALQQSKFIGETEKNLRK